MSTVASNKLEIAAEETRRLITIFCEMEKRRPFTQDDCSFRQLKEEIFKCLTEQRGNSSTFNSTPSVAEAITPSGVSDAATSSVGGSLFLSPDKTQKHLTMSVPSAPRTNGSDGMESQDLRVNKFEDEYGVVAEVIAYFEIASRRTFDIVPMITEHAFLAGFNKALRDGLAQGLGLIGENGLERCRYYAVENPEITVARDELEGRIKILREASDIINQI